MMSLEKIKNRIAKLLALASSPNEAEAQSAMNKAKALMEEHGIRTIDVDPVRKTTQVGDESVIYDECAHAPKWEVVLASTIAECFDCTVVTWRLNGTPVVSFFGTSTDLQFGVDLFKRLRRSISIMAKEYQKTATGHHASVSASYKSGMLRKVSERLQALYVDVPDTMELIVVKQDAVSQAIKDKFGDVKKRKVKPSMKDKEAAMQGYADGDKLGLHRSLKSAESTTQMLRR